MAAITRDPREYRRGLVLGLTFAEIFLLLCFLLMLAASVVIVRKNEERQAVEKQLQTFRGLDRDSLRPTEAVAVLKKALGDNFAVADLVALLERERAGTVEHQTLAAALTSTKNQISDLKARNEQLSASLSRVTSTLRDGGSVRETLSSLEKDNVDLKAQLDGARKMIVDTRRDALRDAVSAAKQSQDDRGRIAELSGQLASMANERRGLESRLGSAAQSAQEIDKRLKRDIAREMIAGGVYPACWQQDGVPEFAFQVVVRSGGRVVVKDLASSARQRERAWQMVAPFPRGMPIGIKEFIDATSPMSAWSLSQDPPCRFYIRVRREMASTEPLSEYLRVIGPLGNAQSDHVPFYRIGG